MLSIDKALGSFMQVSKDRMIRQLRGEGRSANGNQIKAIADRQTNLPLTTYYLPLTKKGSLPTNDPLMKEKHRYITRGNSTFVQAPFPTLLLPVEV